MTRDAARERLIAQVRAAGGDLRKVTGPDFFLDDLAIVLGFDGVAGLLGPPNFAAAFERAAADALTASGRVTVSAPPRLDLFEAADSDPCPHVRTERTYQNNPHWLTCLDCGEVTSGITGKDLGR